MDYADENVIEQTMDAVLEAESRLIPDEVKAILKPDYEEVKAEAFKIQFQIKSVDDEALRRYAKESGMDATQLKDTANPRGILVNTVTINADNKYIRMNRFNIEAGERLKLTHQTNNNSDEYSSVLGIAALADKTPIGETRLPNPFQAILIVSEEVYAALQAKLPEGSDNTNMHMFINLILPDLLKT